MKKKNIGMKVTIIILSILVVGLLGYIVYDKVLNNTMDNNNILNDNVNCNKEINYSSLFDMGTGNIIESASSYAEDGIKLVLYSDKKLYYLYKNDSISAKKEIKISNVSKIVPYSNPGAGIGATFYFLNKDGILYKIDEAAIKTGNSEPSIVSNVSKFIDIGIWNTCKPNAGCGEGVYGITIDGIAHSVTFNSV